MKRARTRVFNAIIFTASFLCGFVARGSAQIPGATNEPPTGSDLPNRPVGLPFGLKVGLVLFALLAMGVAFYFALRAWRASHLFQRQYRLPPPNNIQLRLGAARSGGYMATASFASSVPPTHQKHEGTPPQ